jgi:hypothetical protein
MSTIKTNYILDADGTGAPTFTNGLKTDSIVATTALAIDTVTTGAVNIGTGASSKTITLGNVTGATSLVLNSGTGAINIGTSVAKTITIGNATGATGIVLNSGTAGVTFNTVAAGQFKVAATASPTVDMVNITNAGFSTTTAGVSALQIAYEGGPAAIEASAARIDLTPGAASGGTWNGLRLVPTTAASGVTLNLIKADNFTGGSGTENVLYVGTGYDNIINYNGTTVINGTGNVIAGQLSGTIPSAVLGNSTVYVGSTAILLNRATGTQTLTGVSIDGNAGTVTNGALTTGTLAQFAATTSSQLAGVISDETGSGLLVFATAPTFTTSIDGGATFGAFASSTALTIGSTGTAASTTNISTGAVAASTIKAINIGTGGAASSTTNITLGAAVGGTTTIASPNLTLSGLAATATAATHYYVQTTGGDILPKTLANAKTELVTTAAVNSAAATTVGTITSGTWNGTIIGATYGGTGVNNGTRTITLNTGNLTLTAQAAGSSVTVPASGTLTVTSDKLSVFAATTSAELAGVISDETGTGVLVFGTSPTITTPAITFSTSATVTAGTNAQGQGALTNDYNVVTTTAAAPSGVTLPTATVGRRITVVNKGTNSITIYPATGGTIDALALNAAITLPINQQLVFKASSTTQWYSTYGLSVGLAATASAVAANSVALGTDTTVNYVATVAAGTPGAETSSSGLTIVSVAGEGTATTIAHADTSTLTGAQGSAGIAAFTLDGYGHVTAVTTATYLTTQSSDFGTFSIAADAGYTWGAANTNTSQVADATGDTLTLVRGLTGTTAGIDLFTNTVAGTDAIKIAHADTSTLTGAQGSAGIASFTVDEMGHVTAVTTATYLTAEADTLASVTGRGASTSTQVVLNGGVTTTTTTALTLDSGTTGAINIGTSANAKTITVGNATGATGIVLNSGTAGVTVNTVAAGQLKVQASAAPTVDMVNITNTGFANVTAGVGALQITYVGGAAAVEASAARIDLTPGATASGTWNGLRLVPTAAATSVTVNLIKADAITAGAGTDNVLYVGTGYDNILNYNGTTVINGTGNVIAGQLSGTIPSAVLGNSTVYVGSTAILLNRATGTQTLTGVSIDGNAATATNGALTTGTLAQFAATTSLQLAGVISDEQGSGALVFATSPTFTTSIDSGATFGAFASSTALTLGYTGTAASTTNISTGAVAAATTKTVNIGTGGALSSVTNINIGDGDGGTTAIASPTVTVAGLTATATAATHYYVQTTGGNLLPKTLANATTELVTAAAITTAGAVLTTTAQSIAGIKTFSDATASTTKTTGGVVISGGLGVAGAINAGADVTAYALSDNRLKTNIENIPDALAKVNKLNGVTYNWNDLANELEHKDTSVKEVGVLAQQVNDVLPEVINVRDNGYMAVRYEKMVPLLIEAIKELTEQNRQLAQRLSDLENNN